MLNLDDLRTPLTATGYQHVYHNRDRRRTRPFMGYHKPTKKYVGSFVTRSEAARAMLDYLNGKLNTSESNLTKKAG